MFYTILLANISDISATQDDSLGNTLDSGISGYYLDSPRPGASPMTICGSPTFSLGSEQTPIRFTDTEHSGSPVDSEMKSIGSSTHCGSCGSRDGSTTSSGSHSPDMGSSSPTEADPPRPKNPLSRTPASRSLHRTKKCSCLCSLLKQNWTGPGYYQIYISGPVQDAAASDARADSLPGTKSATVTKLQPQKKFYIGSNESVNSLASINSYTGPVNMQPQSTCTSPVSIASGYTSVAKSDGCLTPNGNLRKHAWKKRVKLSKSIEARLNQESGGMLRHNE